MMMSLPMMRTFSNVSRTALPSASRLYATSHKQEVKPRNRPGFLSVSQLKNAVSNGEIETVIVGFTDHYGRLMGKRYDAEFFLSSATEDGTHACDYLLACDMEMNPIPGFKFANYERGYGDVHLVPDLTTLRTAAWLDKTAMVHCDVFSNKTHELVHLAPRSILRKQVERANAMGFKIFGATELEYFVYKDSYESAFKKGYVHLEELGYYPEDYHILQGHRMEALNSDVRKYMRKSGLIVENSKGEAAVGQHELNIKYDEALNMSDDHIVFKQIFKDVAIKKGMSVTFMAKPHADRAGSSCHVHLSVMKDGENAFCGDESLGPLQCSNYFKWFLGGWIKYTPDIMPFIAPTTNSYKRYVESSWAPTRLAWSYDNRTAGFRIVGSGKGLRIECRLPGADANPYLLFAGSIAAGLKGIEEKIEPPPIFEGDMYQAKQLPRVPINMWSALSHFRKSKMANEAFGEDVVEHYAHFYEAEQRSFERAVTDWERHRYFERI
eukprot:TRINITY_DN1613_c0_g1_i1.p1 TRINITY_DN1613_c0_g1~~TRINITY_DN1613_c0_g1_i1.p1  ORF type:complete len:495 (+),score=104.19 TRINITY_DN1613_c0_g1_i1:53-1537(+)